MYFYNKIIAQCIFIIKSLSNALFLLNLYPVYFIEKSLSMDFYYKVFVSNKCIFIVKSLSCVCFYNKIYI